MKCLGSSPKAQIQFQRLWLHDKTLTNYYLEKSIKFACPLETYVMENLRCMHTAVVHQKASINI